MRALALASILVVASVLWSSSAFGQAKADELREDLQILVDAAKKEEAAGNAAKAAARWGQVMKAAQGRVGQNHKVKEAYFEGYFGHGRSMFAFSKSAKIKEANKEAKYVDFAANHFVKLQYAASKEGWNQIGPRVLEWIDENPQIKASYEKLIAERKDGNRN